jgi:uncharacterized protein (DUF1330 family)
VADTEQEAHMAAYFIVEVEVTDTAGFEDYRQRVPASIAKFGGRYLVRGGRVETIEGDWAPTRVVVLEFPSVEQAKRWWGSEEYSPLKALRQKTARTNAVLVEGV